MANLADMALTPDDRFSIACALYWYCAHYHGGQNSTEYRILSQLEYRPGALEREPNANDDPTARAMYDDLIAGHFQPDDVFAWIEGTTARD